MTYSGRRSLHRAPPTHRAKPPRPPSCGSAWSLSADGVDVRRVRVLGEAPAGAARIGAVDTSACGLPGGGAGGPGAGDGVLVAAQRTVVVAWQCGDATAGDFPPIAATRCARATHGLRHVKVVDRC